MANARSRTSASLIPLIPSSDDGPLVHSASMPLGASGSPAVPDPAPAAPARRDAMQPSLEADRQLAAATRDRRDVLVRRAGQQTVVEAGDRLPGQHAVNLEAAPNSQDVEAEAPYIID